MTNERISEKFPFPSRYAEVYGSKMHYVEIGEGKPILFLHGIPMSCYLWRNIMPYLSSLGRCIAPDLIGFGHSEKPNIEYSILDHIKYIDKFIEELKLNQITLIMHGWGSVIGLDYAMRNEKNCAGLVFYEAFLRPLDSENISLPYQEQLVSLTAIDGASLIDKIIPQTVIRELSDEEMNHYRQPFLKAEASKPIMQYLKELPRGDNKSKADAIISRYSKKLIQSQLPKLMLYSVPGFITTIGTAMWAKDNLPNLEIVDIGEELHLGQETYPELIGETISVWLQGVEQAHA